MARTAILAIKIISDATQAAKGLDSAAGGVSKFERGMGKATAAATTVVAAMVGIGKAAFDQASAVQQAGGAVESVFGKQADQVMGLADAAAQSVGLAKSEYASLASVLGAQLENLGVSQDKLVGTTDTLIQTGADLSAMFGGTSKEAVEALSAAMRGETDPIERYGISLKQADVAAELAAKGQDKLTGEAKKQAETQARLAIIMRQSAKAHGQFGREADTAAGQQQRAAAATKNALADLGAVLLPVVAQAAAGLAQIAQYVSDNARVFQILAGVVGGLAVAILAVNAAMTVFTAVQTAMSVATKLAAAAQWLLNIAMTANPIGLIIAGVVLLVAGFVLLYRRSETFRKAVDTLWAGMKAGLAAVIAWFRQLAATVAQVAGQIAAWFGRAWAQIRAAVAAVMLFLRALLTAYGQLVVSVVSAAVRVFKAGWAAIRAAVAAVVNFIKAYLRAVQTTAATAAAAVTRVFRTAFAALKAAASTFASGVKAVFNAIKAAASAVAAAIRAKLVAAFDALKSAGAAAGRAVLAPFNTLKSAIQATIAAVQRLVSALRNIKVPKLSFPKIPSAFTGGRSVAPAATGAQLYGTTRAGVGAHSTTPTAGGIQITVNGALDPEAVARQIERILAGGVRRRAGVTLRRRAGTVAAGVS